MSNEVHNFRERGAEVSVHPPIVIVRPENVVLKSRIVLDALSFLNAGRGLHIGNCVHVATMVSLIGGGYCVLEDFVGVCAGVRIITGTDAISGEGLVGPTVPDAVRSFYRSYVICKKHVFLGTNAVIHPGVTLAEGAVVASGSIVTRDLEPWGIYMGAPARRVRDRPRDRMLEFEHKVYETYGLKASDFSEVESKIKDELRDGSLA